MLILLLSLIPWLFLHHFPFFLLFRLIYGWVWNPTIRFIELENCFGRIRITAIFRWNVQLVWLRSLAGFQNDMNGNPIYLAIHWTPNKLSKPDKLSDKSCFVFYSLHWAIFKSGECYGQVSVSIQKNVKITRYERYNDNK